MKISDLYLTEKRSPTNQLIKDKVEELLIDKLTGKRRSNKELAQLILQRDDPSAEMSIKNLVTKLKIAPSRTVWDDQRLKQVRAILYKQDGSRLSAKEIADKILGDTSDSAVNSVNNMLFHRFADRDHAMVPISDQEKEEVRDYYYDTEGNIRSNPQMAQLVYGQKEDYLTKQVYYNNRIKGIVKQLVQQDLLSKRVLAEPLSAEEINQAVLWFKSGETVAEIARKLGRAHSAIINHLKDQPNYEDLKDMNQANSSHYITPSQVKYMVDEFTKGVSISGISTKLGVQWSTVKRNLTKRPDYFTDLVPAHLANRRQPPGVSIAEQVFFEIIQAFEDMPKIIRNKNVQLKQGQRRPYNCDGVAGNIAIEFYGDLWHANPAKYPDDDRILPKVGLPAGDIRKNDKIKEDFLKSIGYHVLIVWEKEWSIKANKVNLINRIRKAFSLNAITKEDLANLLLSYTQVNNPQPPTAVK